MTFDAKFYAFLKLTSLATKLIPEGAQFSAEQAEAIHEYARDMAKDLTSGQYVYIERNR